MERRLSNIIISEEGQIAWITLNRPEKLNALSTSLVKELSNAIDELEENEKVRVIIIKGSGKAFSAGADVNEFLSLTPFKAMIYSRRMHELFNKIQFLTKPVISCINGYALGGGLELAMSTDIRIASKASKFGQPEINLGLIPGAGGTQRFPRLLSSRRLELLFTGEMIDAEEALRLGLVDRVFDGEVLEEETRKLAMKIAEKPPLALTAIKYSVHYGNQSNIWTGGALESALNGLMFSTKDLQEGVKAFLEKRKASFKGE